MADNVTVDNAALTDYVVASDDVGGVAYQRIKLDVGGDGASVPVVGALPIADGGASITVDSPQLPAALVSGRLPVDASGVPIAVTGTFWQATQPISAASLPLPAGAAAEHVTAASPHSARLSDGAAFYDAAKTGQLPSALVGGRLDVNLGATIAVPVTDNGGSLTVDGTVAISGTVPISAASLPLPTGAAQEHATAGSPGSARLSDGASFYDAAKTGQLPAALVSGRLDVNVGASTTIGVSDAGGSLTVDNAGTFAVQDSQVVADNAGFTDGTTKVFPSGFIFDEVAGTSLTENDAAAARIDSKRAQIAVLEDASTRGQRATVSAAGALKVDGSAVTQPVSGTITANIGTSGSLALDATLTGGTQKTKIVDTGGTNVATVSAAGAVKVDGSAVTQPVSGTVAVGSSVTPGTAAANLGKAEDAAHADGDVGVMMLAVRNDAGTALAGTTGDYIPLSTDSTGALRVAGGGGGTQFAEDAAHVSGDVGTVALGVRRDADTTPVSADGDYHTLLFDALGNLKVNVKAGSAGGPSKVDDASFGVATDSVAPAGFLADEVTPDSVDEGDVGIARMSLNRNQYVQLRDSSAERSAAVTAANALKTDGSAVTQPVSGTVTANAGTGPFPVSDNAGSLTVDAPVGTPVATRLSDGTAFLTTTGGRLSVDASGVPVPITDNAGSLTVDNGGTFAVQDSQVLTDNGAFVDGTSKLFMTGFIFDESAGTALSENDAAAARVNANRAVVGVIEDDATRGRRLTITAANAAKVDGSAVTQPVSGTVTANAGTGPFPVSDNAGSLTVDAPVGTPVFVRLSDGTAALTTTGGRLAVDGSGVTQPISAASLPLPTGAAQEHTTAASPSSARLSDGTAFYDAAKTGQLPSALVSGRLDVNVGASANLPALGTVAHDAVGTGVNPVLVGGYASNAPPADVSADGDATRAWVLRSGAVVGANAQTAPQTFSWTSATSLDTVSSIACVGYGSAIVTINPTSTFTAGAISFEVSNDNGTTWWGIQAMREDGPIAELSYAIVANTKRHWEIDVGGWTNFRVRLNPAITGTGTLAGAIILSAAPPVPSVLLGGAATATLANVSGSASSVALFAVNLNRKGAVIVNDSSADLFINYGGTASSTAFSYKIPANGGTWEMPVPLYLGAINGIWTSATGAARTTELT